MHHVPMDNHMANNRVFRKVRPRVIVTRTARVQHWVLTHPATCIMLSLMVEVALELIP